MGVLVFYEFVWVLGWCYCVFDFGLELCLFRGDFLCVSCFVVDLSLRYFAFDSFRFFSVLLLGG